MKKKVMAFATIALLVMMALTAADYYDTGSQIFMINAGVDIPLSVSFKDESSSSFVTNTGIGMDGTHINVGGYGSIDYEVFSSSKFALGGEIGYQFNYCADGVLFTQVPMAFKVSYVPLQGTFEIPISLGAGFSYMTYNEKSIMSPTLMAEIGFRFFSTENWGFGIKSGIKATFELYATNPKKTGIGTFIPVHLFASYRH